MSLDLGVYFPLSSNPLNWGFNVGQPHRRTYYPVLPFCLRSYYLQLYSSSCRISALIWIYVQHRWSFLYKWTTNKDGPTFCSTGNYCLRILRSRILLFFCAFSVIILLWGISLCYIFNFLNLLTLSILFVDDDSRCSSLRWCCGIKAWVMISFKLFFLRLVVSLYLTLITCVCCHDFFLGVIICFPCILSLVCVVAVIVKDNVWDWGLSSFSVILGVFCFLDYLF